MKKKVTRRVRVIDYSRLHVWKFGLAGGKICALVVFITVLSGLYNVLGGFPMLNLFILDMYGRLGFSISWAGAIIGAVYAFVDGFILAALFAWVYNRAL
jgi:hypothetical protein